MKSTEAILTTDQLSAGYTQSKQNVQVLANMNLALKKATLTCLLGPNGAGKSTLIRTLTGIQKPLAGAVHLDGSELSSFTQKELAKKISLVLTDRLAPGNLTAFALVSLGRFPYTSWLGQLSKADKKLIQHAMEVTGTLAFADRHIGELSDGERQKVMIARALVQDTKMIILDEPTAHLDLPNRMEVFHLLQQLAHESGKAILMSTHELDMALMGADQLWLINEKQVKEGIPEDLVLSGAVEAAFVRSQIIFDYEQGGFRRISSKSGKLIALDGPAILYRWTRNALERNGYRISPEASVKIEITGTRSAPEWKLRGNATTCKTIEELLIKLNTI